MTCIVGLKHDGVVHLGADDAISGDVIHSNGSKIVRFPSGLVVGFAGSLAVQNIMARPEEHLGRLTDIDDEQQLNTAFDRLQSIGNAQIKGAADKAFWAEVLLAKGPSLVYMGNIAGWHRVKEPFRCIGSGAVVATGAMHVLADVAPRERIERSIDAAARYIAGVSKMSHYEVTKA